MKKFRALILTITLCLTAMTASAIEPAGKQEFRDNCARCHGADAKGSVPAMRSARGYVAVDLTGLSQANDGKFPRQQVYDAIDGRKRFPAHFAGDMPTWGLKFQQAGSGSKPGNEKRIQRDINALVDYIESLQER